MRKRIAKSAVLILALAAFACTGALGQGFEDDLFADDTAFFRTEESIVISASRREQKISEAPVAIAVVTRDELVRSGCRDIPCALRRVPGIFVQRLTQGHSEVAIRGLINAPAVGGPFIRYARNILVLLNGRSVFNDVYGGVVWSTIPVSFDDIERIEIVRGPSTAMFGANAVTGVINIITRNPEAMDSFAAKGVAAVNSQDDQTLNIMVEDGYENFAWRFTAERSVQDRKGSWEDYDISLQSFVPNRGDLTDINFPAAAGLPDENITRMNLSMMHRIDQRNSIDIQAAHAGGSISFSGHSGDMAINNTQMDHVFLKGNFNTHLGPHPSQLSISWIAGRLGGKDIDGGLGSKDQVSGLDWRSFDAEAQGVFELSDRDILVAGFNYRKTYAKSGDIYFTYYHDLVNLIPSGFEPNQEFFSFFLNNEYRFSELWKFVVAARYDKFDNPNESRVSPQAILMFTPNDRHTYRLSYSEAIRSPFLVDLFLDADIHAYGYTLGPAIRFQGNQDLEFSVIRNLELGASFDIARRHKLGVSLFGYRYENAITFINNLDPANPIGTGGDPLSPYHLADPQGGFFLTYRNDPNDFEAVGVEVSTEHELAETAKGWFSLTWQQNKYAKNRTKGMPELIANAGVSTDIGRWKVDLSAHYVSEITVPVTNVMDRNMGPKVQGEIVDALVLGNPSPSFQAAVASHYCNMLDRDNRPVGFCPDMSAAPANPGWWTLFGAQTMGMLDPTNPAMVPIFPDMADMIGNPAQFQTDLGGFYAWSLGVGPLAGQGIANPAHPLHAAYESINGFAQGALVNNMIKTNSVRTSTEKANAYLLVNLRIAREMIRDQAEFFVSVENLLNDKHREFPYGFQMERRIIGGVNWRF